MQPLLMMKQTLESPYDPGPLLLDGPHVRFTRPDQFLTRGRRQDELGEAVELTLGPIPGALRWAGPDDRIMRKPSPQVRLTFRPRSRSKLDYGLAPVEVSQRIGEEWITFSEEMQVNDFLRAFDAWHPNQTEDLNQAESTVIEVNTDRFSARILAVASEPHTKLRGIIDPVAPHLMWLQSILHLPGLRGHRERSYEAARVESKMRVTQVPGPFTAYVASMVVGWQDQGGAELAQVNDDLKALGLSWKVQAKRVSAAEVELKVGRLPLAQQGGAHDLVDIADVGFGVSQVLPVVVALTAAKKGQVVYIEQPELHLHPKAQYQMGLLLARSATRGVRIVVETHSRMVLRAVQTAIAKPGGLRKDDVALHWFERDPESGYSKVKLAELDSTGAFGDWPIDFSEVEAEADEEWLDHAFGHGDG
ncbi:MAG: hypothetical protein EA397_05585 [Deltaproteobacteria bacterium]|nr:MAG: hypothetical protein EA397_05585 [Deltaproteobacteria bacterium]